jgi:hypothetical protein
MTTKPNPGRTVHGRTPNGAEIVRYDRSSKWWREPASGRRIRINVFEAATLAVDGEWFEGKPGGGQFDRLVRKLKTADAELATS